ncbi:MAG: TonB family protein [Bacteroidia bacterium]|nr:TonB family protein [Bacteroidia bacterium]
MAKHLKADLDDMVFEDRERNYGAYFLRKRYPKYLRIAVGTVAFIALCGSFGPLLAKSMGWIKGKLEIETKEVFIDITKLPPPPKSDELNEPPPPPPPPERRVIKQMSFPIPEPSPDPDLEDTTTIHKLEDLVDQNLSFKDVDGEDEEEFFTGIGEGDEPEVIVDPDPPSTVFGSADEEPVPINIKEIASLVGYPAVARQAEIQGKVIVRILVDKNGAYKKHKVLVDPHPLLTEAVEKHLDKLTFTPAIQGGRPIKFWINVPFDFRLLNN